LVLTVCFAPRLQAQSVLNPADPVVTYNPAAPPTQPAFGTIGKWVKTRRVSWNTNNYKCYIYKGQAFRLRFPQSYNPTAPDGKKYPILVFFHGLGEAGPVTDNEYQMFHGGQVFDQAATAGKFDGFVFFMQTTNGFWGQPVYGYIKELLDYMITNNKLDPFRISFNGLSGGGAGTWDMSIAYPQYTAASLPMSAASLDYLNTAPPKLKFTPMWLFQGGLDGSPDPGTTQLLVNAMNSAGGNLKYTIYPDLGHTTWDRAWTETDFWPFLNRAYESNPWALFGRTQFCPGDPINITVGLTAGFDGYQWRKDGVLLASTTNTINVTQLGTYDAQVRRNGVWSDWSRIPLVVSIKQPTVTPNITIPPLTSNVIPALDNTTGVTLQVPTGYTSYLWQQVGNNTTLSTTNTLNATNPGNYQVKVTEQFGCSSSFSTPYTVINANGTNKPSPAASLTITTVSQTSLRLDWAVNPSQQFPQTGFEVYQGTKAGGPYKIIALLGAGATNTTTTGLNPGAKYYYIVRAVNGNAAAAASNEAFGTTASDIQPPTAPSGLTVTGISRSSAALNWTASTDNVGVTSYDIYVNGKKVQSTTGTAFTVYDLKTGNNYNFSVTARDFAKNISPFSNQVTTVPIATGLTYKYYTFDAPPANLPNYATLVPDFTGFSTTTTSLTPTTQNTNYGFLWEGYLHITTAGTYQIRTASVDGSKVYLGALNATGSPYLFSTAANVSNDGVHSNRTVTSSNITLAIGVYPIAIAYFHAASGSGAITLSWKTPTSGNNFATIPNTAFSDAAVVNGQPPAAPSNLVATALAYNKVNLAWTDNSNNETAFEIWRSTTSGSGFNTVGIAGPGAVSYIDSTLTANTQYYYQVRAIGQYGQSALTAQSGVVTLALPGAPAAPTGLIARGTSTASTVTIHWTDNAANEDSYQVYRSAVNNTNYLLLATLPANTLSFKDVGLFANAVYYYQVRAVNAGGPSAFSNEDSAHTADNIPVLTAITPAQYMRYGTQLVLNLQATDADPETLTLQVTNKPAFATFASTGNGTGTLTFNPTQSSDQGIYSPITVTVTDPNGGSATQNFSLTVNNNFNPVITRPVANVSLNESATATVNLAATDQNTTDVLTWSFKGLPGFATVTPNGGSASMALAPGYADAGSYPVQIRVDDGNQGFDTLTFTINVANTPLPAATSVSVHFSGPDGATAGSPWNNTLSLPSQNKLFTNLKDQTGAISGLRLTITTPWQTISFGDGTNTYGATTGNNSGVYPDAVLGSAYFTDQTPNSIRVSGLDIGTTYNFTFFGSRGSVNDDRTSIYSVTTTAGGTSSVSLQTANNTANTVSINNVAPNPDSTVLITLAKGAGAPYGYINSVVITKIFNDHSVPARPRNIAGQIVNNSRVSLTWLAAAYNALSYQVYRSQTLTGPYTLLNPGAANPTQAAYTDSLISQNNSYYYYVTATNANGVSPSSDTVPMLIPNLAPVFGSVANITAQAGQTSTANITTTDAPADVITLQASGLPAFASFTDNGNGTGTISFAPATSDIGTYSGTITATDNHGASSNTTVNISVTFANLRNIYIHFNDGTSAEPAQAAPWNNTNSVPNAGVGIANLKDDQGALTGYGITLLDAWAGANNTGTTTGNNSGVYPDNVMQSFYYDDGGAAKRMNITGLSPRSKYNVIFFAGRGNVSDNRITRYAIGSQSVQLNAASNTTQTVQINNVTPDATGKILLSMTKDAGAPFALIGAIQIQYSYDTTFYGPTGLSATSPNISTIILNWASNSPATTTSFEIWRGTTPTGPFSLLNSVGAGVTSYTDGGMTQGSTFFYEVRAIAGARQSAFSNIAGGSTVTYTVNIQFNDGSSNLAQGGIWNSTNTLVYPGFLLPNLINTKGQQTGINMGVVTNFSGYNTLGTTTGNNSGVYPDNVMQGFFYEDFGDTARLAIGGLDLTSTYNFGFFGSRGNPATSVISTYQIGNTIVTQDATNNTSRVTQIAGVKPDSTGTILLVMYNSTGGRGYLNALTIDGVPNAFENFAQTPVATMTIRNGQVTATAGSLTDSTKANALVKETKVKAFPNPFRDGVNLSFELPQPVARLLVSVVDVSGRVVFRQEMNNLPAGVSVQRLSLDSRNMPTGNYFIILQGMPEGTSKSLQLLKVK
jgi:fibronectin type 3 domain-containing protein/predicted esterase